MSAAAQTDDLIEVITGAGGEPLEFKLSKRGGVAPGAHSAFWYLSAPDGQRISVSSPFSDSQWEANGDWSAGAEWWLGWKKSSYYGIQFPTRRELAEALASVWVELQQ